MAILENWSLRFSFDPYLAPELQVPRLHGQVHGHNVFPDGAHVTTNHLAGVFGESVVTRSGTVYELGQVDPAYEAAFPNARQRLFDSLKKAP